MATNTKELLQKAYIRTMKKDIKKLREITLVKKSEEIIKPKAIPQTQKPLTDQVNVLIGENLLKQKMKPTSIATLTKQPKPPTEDQIIKTGNTHNQELNLKKEQELTASKTGFDSDLKKEIEENKTMPQTASYKENPYLKEIPLAVGEKPKPFVKVEERQRKKFMEDVEAWASSSSKNNNKNNE